MNKNAVLAIETGIGEGSLSLWRNASVIEGHIFREKISRSADLLTAIEETLRRAETAPNELRKVFVSKEIGSLTGIRVGAATALGLKNSLSIDYAAFDIFDALQAFYGSKIENGLIALASGKNKIFWKPANDALPRQKASEINFDDEFIENILKPAISQRRAVCVNESLHQKIFDSLTIRNSENPSVLADELFYNAGNNLAFYYGSLTAEVDKTR